MSMRKQRAAAAAASLSAALLYAAQLPVECGACRMIVYAGEEEASGRKLLLESENGLPALAFSQPHRWDTLLRATTTSEYWEEQQCKARNAQENRDA